VPQVPGHHLQASPAEMEHESQAEMDFKKKSLLQKIISQRPEYIQTHPHARGEIPV